MTNSRCPRCRGRLVDEILLAAGDPPVTGWWCSPCDLVVRHDQALADETIIASDYPRSSADRADLEDAHR